MPKLKSKKPLDSALSRRAKEPCEPLWQGPDGAGPNGGVTQSLLARYLCCKERFRVKTVEGLSPVDTFEPRIEYGNMWHVCEEALAKPKLTGLDSTWERSLQEYVRGLCSKYRMQQDAINDWYEKCKAQFPLYVAWWRDHVDVKDRTPLLQEQVFDVPYRLPSGRTVRLRGKWDSVDLIGKGKAAGIYVQENKTKSSIDAAKIARQVTFDLQSMFYLVALETARQSPKDFIGTAVEIKNGKSTETVHPIAGVRYNVIKRSAHKSIESMLKKINEDIADGRGGEWFSRWKIEILPGDVEKFRRECLDPVLENLCDDYEWWDRCLRLCGDVWRYEARRAEFPEHQQRHYRYPYGIYNVLDEGGFSDVDEYLSSGSTVGLYRPSTLFPELS